MKKIAFLLLFALTLAQSAFAQPKIQLVDFATGFSRPVDITNCGDSRLFVVEQAGRIWVLDSLGNRLSAEPFLNIDPLVNSNGNEQGLLGLAFHPNYAQNGQFYVHYSDNSGDTQISRFLRDPLDPNKADPTSEKKILFQDQPYSNHNGGGMSFGPDGYLYIGIGDGGSGGDPQNFGQNKQTFLGKILRIDVDGGDPYAVPADNPFVNDPAWKPEIWHTGLRNPWRWSFDRLTGDMWIGDVGQNAREEIDFQPAGMGGINYGWRCYEGNNTYNTSGCQPQSSYLKPAFEYANPSLGCSVTGGFVYRGSKYPEIFGTYLFADYCSGRWWATVRRADGTFSTKEIANLSDYQFSSFGQDRTGELYVAQLGAGKISRVTELCSPFQISGTATPAICPGAASGTIDLNITGAATPFSITWSNGASNPQVTGLNPGTYSVLVKDANACERRDTFTIAALGLGAPSITPIGGQAHLCGANDTLQLAANDVPQGIGYQWFSDGNPLAGQTTQLLSVTAPGNFSVEFTGDVCPPVPSAPLAVTQSAEPVSEKLGGDSLIVYGQFVVVQWEVFDASTQAWNPIPGATENLYLAPTEGLFRAAVVDAAGCRFFTTPLGVSASQMPREVARFALQPNPTTDKIRLEMDLTRPLEGQFTLADATQKTLLNQQFSGKNIRQTLDLSALPAGSYFLTVRTDAGSFVRTVVKI
ncbi:MAG: PQQ-dependent sugar dehydrogenase [Saprospiraceae bacterium]